MIFLLTKNFKICANWSVKYEYFVDNNNNKVKKSIFLLHFQKVDSLENILLKSFREKYVEWQNYSRFTKMMHR